VFTSEFLILTSAMRQLPWAIPVLLLALAVAFAAVFARTQSMVLGDSNLPPVRHPPALLPVFVHLGLTLMLGLYIPPFLADWYRQAASLIGG
jgi:formate hydrogenlyase subunit 3/multisubunit Na+/H+ antiporter MnhD subunit